MAQKKVNSIAELSKLINVQTILPALDALGEQIFQKWYDTLNEEWYNQYDPIVYRRTKAILKALVKTKATVIGDYVSVSVFIDESIMAKYHPNSQSSALPETIIDIVEFEGMTLSNGVERNPAEAYEQTIEWLRGSYKKYLYDILKGELKLNVKIN